MSHYYEFSSSHPSWKMFDISSYCPFNDLLPIRWWATSTTSFSHPSWKLFDFSSYCLYIGLLPTRWWATTNRVLLISPHLEVVQYLKLLSLKWSPSHQVMSYCTTPTLTSAGRCSISQASVPLMISSPLGDEPLLRVLLLSPQLKDDRYLKLLSL